MKSPNREPRRRSPQLLVLVFVLTLCLVAATAAALAVVVGDGTSSAAIRSSIAADRALVGAFVAQELGASDAPAGIVADHRAALQQFISSLIHDGFVRIKLYSPDGTIQLSDDPSLEGTNNGLHEDIEEAFDGEPNGDLTRPPFDEPDLYALHLPVLLEEYLPVNVGSQIPAVFEVYRDAAPILAQTGQARDQVLLVTLIAAMLLAVLLYFVFRSADRLLKRQTKQLLEATRRDPLTGMLTHGAVVERLAIELETAMATDHRLGLALVDIDNFRLLNDSHGHAAGDHVLRQIADLLGEELPAGAVVGRYGPDEFLIVAPPPTVEELRPGIERLRGRLAELGPRFEGTERLPLSVSAGLCSFPEHGRSATELLSIATVALSQARMSGGDQVRVADTIGSEEGQTERASFDVLQGLVIAVDTKDRYTKRHSEDVARYALFLADQLDLPLEWRRTLHIAGLLHDIGKIGIPDSILRKPAPLTADEYAIVKQHVALGHMIVRDLPYLDLVRAGIRFHHEQWDGAGYLEGLRGDEIPFVARILGVADAFSAMTTSRPYRKALSIKEALTRLVDASGSQLDPSLVTAFVQGMETAADAPVPGDEAKPLPRIWLPEALTGARRAAAQQPVWQNGAGHYVSREPQTPVRAEEPLTA